MDVEKILSIAKRRGFFYPCSEIHGSISGFWDYGPLGTALKKKIEEEWRKFFIKQEGFYEVEGSNIMPEKVFVASGHLKGFSDPLVQCKKCKSLHRADKLIQSQTETFVPEKTSLEKFDEIIENKKVKCPNCNGNLSKTRFFNMMFQINVGPTDQVEVAYLRPETCQTIFADFLNVHRAMRAKLPFGIAQIGRSYRNEISPRQCLLRQREFIQAEAEIFFDETKINDFPAFEKLKDYKINIQIAGEDAPKQIKLKDALEKTGGKIIAYYLARVQQFIHSLGIPLEAIRIREMDDEERPFYAKCGFDCEVKTPLGWIEVVANHYRADYDLKSHSEISGKDLKILENGKKITPHVWEISEGVDRTLFCVMLHSYREGKERGWEWFQFSPKISPFHLAVYPLVSKGGLPEKAKEVHETLKKYLDVFYDEPGSIGKRYARADEVGTFLCVTIDYDTLKDSSVTLRSRDTTQQIRVKIEGLANTIKKLVNQEIEFEKAGKLI